ncbi:MAG: cysteine hydrolase family protein [Pseudomonadota bacterium]
MKQALLVIDVQRGLFDAVPRPDEADAVVDRINALAARARAAGAPVVFVQHEDGEGGELAHGSPGWHLEQRLVVGSTDVHVRKSTPDSFLRTDLGALLERWSTEQVVICGYASEFCVDTTTRRAAALGYPVILAADAHTTHDKPHATARQIRAHHNATLSAIGSFGRPIVARVAADIAFAAQAGSSAG